MCTPDQQDPNNVKKSTTDSRSPVIGCQHRKDKVQLLPIRYALVEKANIDPTIKPPHKLKSRPVGLRLIRDGYLYIYEDTGLFYEYKLKDGQVTELLWCHNVIPDADKRTIPQETNPKLLFNRTSNLAICYSEIQWTIAKCKQILDSASERKKHLQPINLTAVDCSTGGKDLLTEQQLKKYLADLIGDEFDVTQPILDLLIDKTIARHGDEIKSYIWDKGYQPATVKTQAQQLIKSVASDYQNDHLYLIVNDEIGLLRDLAEYQDAIMECKKKWSANKDIQYQYIVGSYVESLYVIDEQTLTQVASNSEEYKDFAKDTSPQQKQAVLHYIETKNRGTYREEDSIFSSKSFGFDQWKKDVAQAEQDMKTSLGDQLYAKYKDYIEAMDINTANALNGAKWGQLGIQERINRPAMEAFLAKQRKYLSYVNSQIDNINQDRGYLFEQKSFFKHAWYYCAKSAEQTLAHGETHYNVYKDLGLTEDNLTKISTLMEADPKVLFPILYTLPADEQDDTSEKILNSIQAARNALFIAKDTKGLLDLSESLTTLIEDKAPHALNLTGKFSEVNAALSTIYDPASQKALAAAIVEIRAKYSAGNISLDDLIRTQYPKSRFAKLLVAYKRSGLTLTFASLQEMQLFDSDVKTAQQLREQRSVHKTNRRYYERKAASKSLNSTSRSEYQAKAQAEQAHFQAKGKELLATERRIANAISATPTAEGGAGRLGVHLEGLTANQLTELYQMAEDYRLGRTAKLNALKNVFSPKGGDFWAMIVWSYQLKGFVSAAADFFTKKETSLEDRLQFAKTAAGFLSATFGMAQGISATILDATLASYSSTAGKLSGTMKFGACIEAFGVVGYFFGIITAVFGVVDHAQDLINARDNCKTVAYAGGVAALGASIGQTGLNTYGFARSATVIYRTYQAYGWARLGQGLFLQGARSITFLARFSIIGLGLTILELAGEYLYNRYNISRLDEWLSASVWAKNPAERRYSSLIEEDLALNSLINTPKVISQTLNYLDRTKPYVNRITITFPNLTARLLDESQLTIAASVIYDDRPGAIDAITHYTDSLIGQLQLISKEDEPLTLAFDISPEMDRGMMLPAYSFTLVYPVTLQPQPLFNKLTYSVNTFLGNGADIRTIEPSPYLAVWHKGAKAKTLTLTDIMLD